MSENGGREPKMPRRALPKELWDRIPDKDKNTVLAVPLLAVLGGGFKVAADRLAANATVREASKHSQALHEFEDVPPTPVKVVEIRHVDEQDSWYNPSKRDHPYAANTAFVDVGRDNSMRIWLMTGKEEPRELNQTEIVFDLPEVSEEMNNPSFWKNTTFYRPGIDPAEHHLTNPGSDLKSEVIQMALSPSRDRFPLGFRTQDLRFFVKTKDPSGEVSRSAYVIPALERQHPRFAPDPIPSPTPPARPSNHPNKNLA